MIIDGLLLQLIDGAKITVFVTVLSISFGITLGILGMLLELGGIKIISNVVVVVSSLIRGLPELLVIFAVYFGSTIIIKKIFGVDIESSPLIAGVVALGMIYGAYAVQVFKSAVLIIDKGQIEAAKTLGLSKFNTFRFILFPQILYYSLPGLSNLCLVTLKDSSLIALIGLQDLTFKAQLVANESYKPFTYYMLCALIYLILTSVCEIFFKVMFSRKYGF
jgi:His/Glu/Gln/Arg/opine family amino acid ABC transporter permease subunit